MGNGMVLGVGSWRGGMTRVWAISRGGRLLFSDWRRSFILLFVRIQWFGWRVFST